MDFERKLNVVLGQHRSLEEYREALQAAGINVGPSALEMLGDAGSCGSIAAQFHCVQEEESLPVGVYSVEELGSKDHIRHDDLLRLVKQTGGHLCPAEIGPAVRLQMLQQKPGTRLLILMAPITTPALANRQGHACIFCLECDKEGQIWLTSERVNTGERWAPTDIFVIVESP